MFKQFTFAHCTVIGLETSSEVSQPGNTILTENPFSKVATQSHGAVEDDVTVLWDLLQSVTEIGIGDVHSPFNGTEFKLLFASNVKHECAVHSCLFCFIPTDGVAHTFEDIDGNEADHVYGILRTGEGRSIGLFKLCQVIDRSYLSNEGGDDIDTFVDPAISYGLSTPDFPCLWVVEHFQ